jgi:DNA repair exonuclease SbcCD ATPase subunit
MQWENIFSYGSDNSINFDSAKVTQLIGKNGHGKSSIALILEEVLFNKNSKGIKRGNILNRYSGAKAYNISLEFSKGEDTYNIITNRGATQSVRLLKNGEDISAHTSTGTYKAIEEVLGYDHKMFSQIVYQNNPFSLEFLTATDTARKKFLIDLLNLTKYNRLADYYKERSKEVSKLLDVAKMSLSSVDSWLHNLNKNDLNIRTDILDVPELDLSIDSDIVNVQQRIENITSINQRINKNNTYKKMLDAIDPPVEIPLELDATELNIQYSTLQAEARKFNNVIKGTGPILTKCPSCGQNIDASHKVQMLEEAKISLAPIQQKLQDVEKKLKEIKAHNDRIGVLKNKQLEWEKLHTLYDPRVEKVLLDPVELETLLKQLKAAKTSNVNAIDKATKHNNLIIAHNTKVEVLLSQKSDMLEKQSKLSAEVAELTEQLSLLQILVKSFSPNGLVAYKLEVLVKDLEDIANKYLQEMSSGRFQLSFRLNSSDKLDVVITDNGTDIDIQALSNGELARVNVSTLLAIRKLMQAISDTRTNLLILDETVESLDSEGKEKLIEILIEEEYLNTILVSHGFSHPLLEKLHITKKNNISRIE